MQLVLASSRLQIFLSHTMMYDGNDIVSLFGDKRTRLVLNEVLSASH